MAATPDVVPRWEWRTFGPVFTDLETRLRHEQPTPRTSHETYIIAPPSDVNIKIRDQQLDVKLCVRSDRDLELWRPVLKAPFPVTREVVGSLFGHWSLAPPPFARAAYTQEQLLTEIVGVSTLRAVAVAKERRGAVIGGCVVEVATLKTCGCTVRTAAVEAEDPDAVRRVVAALGLAAHPNINYIAALKRMLADGVRDGHAGAREGALS